MDLRARLRAAHRRAANQRTGRLTHHVHILEFNGDSFRLKQSKTRRRSVATTAAESQAAIEPGIDPETGEILAP